MRSFRLLSPPGAGILAGAIVLFLVPRATAIAGISRADGAGPDSRPLPHVLRGRSEEGRTQFVEQGTGKLALCRRKWKHIPPGPYTEWAVAKHNNPESPIATPVPSVDDE